MGLALEVRGLVKRYGTLVAVDGIDFEVAAGTCLGLLGPNGAGKTTTIEVLEGLLEPDGGEVRILGRTWREDAQGIRRRIGVQLQETDLLRKLTVTETLRLFASFYPAPRPLADVLHLVGLGEKRGAQLEHLSGGQRQRLTLGCALVGDPDLLFLDEPTTGLDPQARRRVWEIVETFKAEGGTVLLTTHYMEEAERLADELVVVDRGRVVARGRPAALIDALEAETIVRLAAREAHRARAEALFTAGALGKLPGVREARLEQGGFVLAVAETQAAIGALLALMAAERIELEDLSSHRPTLEDVFVALTGRHLRDA